MTASASVPLISCLMVTRGALRPARFAIACFQAQSWPGRELVIVGDAIDGDLRAHLDMLADPAIRLVECDPAPLGALRTTAVAAARGDLVAQWDDDDLYAPDRLAAQYAALDAGGFDALLLHRWMLWWPARYCLALSERRPWEGSMLAYSAAIAAYPQIARGEDSAMLAAMARNGARIGLLDRPDLYCYIHHGANAWGRQHFAGLYSRATQSFEFADYEPALARLRAMPIAGYRAWIETD